MAKTRKPIPKTQEQISNEQITPFDSSGNPNNAVPNPKNRALQTSFKGDDVKPFSVGIEDIDESIFYYFKEVIKPSVIQNGERLPVPVIYGSPEKWKSFQKDGYYRDQNGKIMAPLIMFKRTDISKNRSIANKLDANNPNNFGVFNKKYSPQNSYDNFKVLNNRAPQQEYYAVVMPDYLTVTYTCIVFTYYIEQLNKIVEAIEYTSDAYWGDPQRYQFKAAIDSFGFQNELTEDNERIVRSTFDIKINGYIIPEILQKDVTALKKFSNKTKVLLSVETSDNPAIFGGNVVGDRIVSKTGTNDGRTVTTINGGQSINGGGGGGGGGQSVNVYYNSVSILDNVPFINFAGSLDVTPFTISGLNGVTVNAIPFPYTGSAIITGSLIVTGSILPGTPTSDLGSLTRPWNDIYLSGNSLYFVSGSDYSLLSYSSGSVSGSYTGSFSGAFTGSLNGTASYALTASYIAPTLPTQSGPYVVTYNIANNNLGYTVITSGTNGSSGASGTSGSSGASGTSGFSGTSGTNGSSGISGTNGSSGASGSSGTSGTNGSSGISGTNGSSGSSGISGTNGSSGISGTNGSSGASGSSGTSGTNGANGISAGQTYYFNESQNSDVSGYKVLATTPSTASQQTVTTNLTGNQQNVLVSDYITPQLGFAVIPGGTQRFHLHYLKPASNDNIDAYVEIQLADSSGTPIGPTITSNISLIGWVSNVVPVEVNMDIVLSTTTIDPTNRMIVRLYLNNNDSSSKSIIYYTEGNSYYSFVLTSVGVIGGTSGTSGSSGASGTSGSSGASGTNGSSGTSGINGSSGESGTSGSSGLSYGTSGTSGFSGTSGENGSSGLTGSSGTSGTSSPGTSGASGSSGTSGGTGSSGEAGTSGSSGTSGTGSPGTSGTSGNSASLAIGSSITSATSGSVLFAGAAGVLQQDNSNFFWDDTNNRLGIGTSTPADLISVLGNTTSTVQISARNTNAAGDTRFALKNNTTGVLGVQCTGTTYYGNPAAYFYTQGGLEKLSFSTDGDLAAGGSGFIQFSTGGYNASQERMRILANGNVSIGGTTSISKLAIPVAPTATANYGLVSLGSGAFDGSTAGYYIGDANGTVLAINTVTGYTGNLMGLQRAGVNRLSVDYIGSTNIGYTATVSKAALGISGNAFTGGTGTTTKPVFMIEEIGCTNWNTTGAMIGINTRGSFSGFFLDFQTNNFRYMATTATTLLLTNSGGIKFSTGQANSSNNVGIGYEASGVIKITDAGSGYGGLKVKDIIATGTGYIVIGSTSQLASSRLGIPIAPTASSNYGLFSLGSGAFDGTTSGFFTGAAAGTLIAGNLAAGSTSELINLQVGGVSRFKIDSLSALQMTGFRINPNSAAQAELLAGTSIDTFTGGVSLQFLASPAAPGTARIQFGSYTNGQWYSQLDILNNQSGTTADVYLMQAGQGNLGIRTNNPKAPIHIGGSPTANANYGTLSMGTTASFDGVTAGKFSGSANGTFFAINKTTGSANYLDFQNNGISLYKIDNVGKPSYETTITAGGITGNQTINKTSGTVNIAAAGTTVTVTNSLVTTSSIVFAVIRTNDTTAYIKNVVPGAGSFDINLGAAATAEISIGFIVNN